MGILGPPQWHHVTTWAHAESHRDAGGHAGARSKDMLMEITAAANALFSGKEKKHDVGDRLLKSFPARARGLARPRPEPGFLPVDEADVRPCCRPYYPTFVPHAMSSLFSLAIVFPFYFSLFSVQ